MGLVATIFDLQDRGIQNVTAGAFTLIFSRSPCQPMISLRPALALIWTVILKRSRLKA